MSRPISNEGDWSTERRFITIDNMVPEQRFNRNECHLKSTGVCSLEHSQWAEYARRGDGYERCQKLARAAQLWQLVREFLGDEVPSDEGALRALTARLALRRFIRRRWNADFGPVPRLQHCLVRAITLYWGKEGTGGVEVVERPNGQLRFHDGRHRTCVGTRLGIPVAATVEVKII